MFLGIPLETPTQRQYKGEMIPYPVIVFNLNNGRLKGKDIMASGQQKGSLQHFFTLNGSLIWQQQYMEIILVGTRFRNYLSIR